MSKTVRPDIKTVGDVQKEIEEVLKSMIDSVFEVEWGIVDEVCDLINPFGLTAKILSGSNIGIYPEYVGGVNTLNPVFRIIFEVVPVEVSRGRYVSITADGVLGFEVKATVPKKTLWGDHVNKLLEDAATKSIEN